MSAFVMTSCAGPSAKLQQSSLSRLEAYIISQRLSAAIESRYPLLEHRRVNRYVETLGQQMVSQNRDLPPLLYEFKVLKTNEILSFSTPMGAVYVSLGLLRLCEWEGQFAAAMAHELGHQKLGHPLQLWASRVQEWRRQGDIDSANWSDRLFGSEGLFYYGEAMEREADQMALVILYRAQYDNRVLLAFFQSLIEMENKKSPELSGMASLMPSALDRLNWSKADAAKIPPVKDGRLNSKGFIALQSLLKKTAKHATKVKKPDASVPSNPDEGSESF